MRMLSKVLSKILGFIFRHVEAVKISNLLHHYTIYISWIDVLLGEMSIPNDSQLWGEYSLLEGQYKSTATSIRKSLELSGWIFSKSEFITKTKKFNRNCTATKVVTYARSVRVLGVEVVTYLDLCIEYSNLKPVGIYKINVKGAMVWYREDLEGDIDNETKCC